MKIHKKEKFKKLFSFGDHDYGIWYSKEKVIITILIILVFVVYSLIEPSSPFYMLGVNG